MFILPRRWQNAAESMDRDHKLSMTHFVVEGRGTNLEWDMNPHDCRECAAQNFCNKRICVGFPDTRNLQMLQNFFCLITAK